MNRAWLQSFAAALEDLGLPAARIEHLVRRTADHLVETGEDPRALLGPPTAYARSVAEALAVPAPDLAGTTSPEPMAGPVLLELDGVYKRFRDREVLQGVDLRVRAGEVLAVIGANGSGKSTLLRLCAGLIKPDRGQIRRRGSVGYVPQDGGLYGLLTPQEHFELFGAAAGLSLRKAQSTGEHLASRLFWRPDRRRRSDQLSGGTRQKLNLVLGELHGPDLLLLDEPYQGFDQGTYLNFWNQVFGWRDSGKGVVVVTHILHELNKVDLVLDLTRAEASVSQEGARPW